MWRETHLWPAQQSSPSTLASITRGNSLSYWPWLVPSRDSVSTVPSWSKLTRVQYSFGTEDTYSLFTDCCSLTFPFCRLLQRGGGGVGGCCRARLWRGRETWCLLLIVWARARDIHSYIFYYLSRKGFSKTICMGCEHMRCEPNKEEAEGKQ